MNILLIGNGFDLAHGLPTNYRNFMDFLRILPEPFPNSFPSPLNAWKQAAQKVKEKNNQTLASLWEPFANAMPGSSASSRYFLEILEMVEGNFWVGYLKAKYYGKRSEKWVDFEGDIREVIRFLDLANSDTKVPHLDTSLKNLWNIMPDAEKGLLTFNQWIQSETSLIDRLYADLRRLTRCFEIYLSFCVMENHLFAPKQKVKIPYDIQGVLSFNYTDTLARFHHQSAEYCYIHGKAKRDNTLEDNNMVFGIDEYLPSEERSTRLDYVVFRKYYQRIFNRTDYQYTDWIQSGMSHNLHIIGHSLEETDGDVLRELILHRGVITTVYYRDKNSSGRQIQKLIQRLGYDNLNLLARGGDDMGREIRFEPLELIPNP